MKHITAFILALALLLTGCSAKPSSDTSRVISGYGNLCNNGELYADSSGRLNFCDFESLQSVILCSRPNCTHNDPEECSAFGLGNAPMLYGDKLYAMTVTRDYSDGAWIKSTEILSANTDGTGRVTKKTITDRSPIAGSITLLMGNRIYFALQKTHLDEMGNSDGYAEIYLCSYDFSSGEYAEISKAVEGYSSGLTVIGEYNGRVYYNTSHAEEKIPWQNFADPNFDLSALLIYHSYAYDPESGEISEIDEYPIYAGGGVLIVATDASSLERSLIRTDGTRTDISYLTDFDGAVNGYIFSRSHLLAVEISSGKRFELLCGEDDTVRDYSDGKYIIMRNKFEDESIVGREYLKLSAKELIGAEIK